MNQFDFYKELYFKENERRLEVLNSLNIPIAIITALFSGLYLLVTSFDYSIDDCLTYFFLTFIAITGCFLLGGTYFLVRAFNNFMRGYQYEELPYPKELHEWNKALENYYRKEKEGSSLAKECYEEFIIDSLVKNTSNNMLVNATRFEYILRSKQFLIITLVLMLITSIPFGSNHFKKDDRIQKVELMNLSKELSEVKESKPKRLEKSLEINKYEREK